MLNILQILEGVCKLAHLQLYIFAAREIAEEI